MQADNAPERKPIAVVTYDRTEREGPDSWVTERVAIPLTADTTIGELLARAPAGYASLTLSWLAVPTAKEDDDVRF